MDNTEIKIRKGQAMNLAISAAISKERTEDIEYIFTKALFFMDIIEEFQQLDHDGLVSLIEDFNRAKGKKEFIASKKKK